MLGKILLTIIVALIAVVWLRKHRQEERQQTRNRASAGPSGKLEATASKPERLNDYRFAAYLFLALMLGSGTALYYQRWQDDRTLVTVILHNDRSAIPITYQVYKNQLGQRAFTTIDGVRVTVAANERMEVIGL